MMGDTQDSSISSDLRLQGRQQSFGAAVPTSSVFRGTQHSNTSASATATAPRAPSEDRQFHTSNSGATYELGSGDLNQLLEDFWQSSQTAIESIDPEIEDFRTSPLPLARIKKIMKLDEDVRMVAHDAPLVFAKACEMFIEELTLRGWDHTDKNKRRTLQRSDVATATGQSDIFDFLIDIVPRESQEMARDDNGHKEDRAMVPNGQQQQPHASTALLDSALTSGQLSHTDVTQQQTGLETIRDDGDGGTSTSNTTLI